MARITKTDRKALFYRNPQSDEATKSNRRNIGKELVILKSEMIVRIVILLIMVKIVLVIAIATTKVTKIIYNND